MLITIPRKDIKLIIKVLPLKLSKYLIAIFNALNLTAYIILVVNENIMRVINTKLIIFKQKIMVKYLFKALNFD
ncbi:MAG: hypothetical protein ACP5E7_06415 [Hydrogenobaculum sp.]